MAVERSRRRDARHSASHDPHPTTDAGAAGDQRDADADAAGDADLRPFVLLLVLDALVGVWSSLHAPALQRFFITQIPLIGLAGLLWGFLEGDLKPVVAKRLLGWLRKPATYRTLVGLTTAFVVFTLGWSTVEVSALEPTSSELVFRANGTPRDLGAVAALPDSAVCPDSAAHAGAARSDEQAGADSALLNRLTTPLSFGMWIWPAGRNVWFYTGTHVSGRAIRVWPWWRRSLQYPEDFDEVAAVRALPMFPLFTGLRSGCSVVLVLREHDANGLVLAADTLSSLTGLQLAYRDSLPLDSLARRRWDDSLRLRGRREAIAQADSTGAAPPDSAALLQLDSTGAPARAVLTRRWSQYRVVHTRRPLHVGEHIYWEVRGKSRARLLSGEVELRRETDIILGAP